MGLIFSIIILIFSAILHEVAHGYVAYRLGDPTAKLRGRLTLNPIPHIDPFFTVLLPIIVYLASGGRAIFGGAKPVPVDLFNLRDTRKDYALISLAGPLTNIIIAVIASILLHVLYPGMSFDLIGSRGIPGFILTIIVNINLLLATFNLLPIPPLDGSKVFSLVLPHREAAVYLSLGANGLLLMVLLFFPLGGFSIMDIVFSLRTFSLSLLGF